MSATISVSVRDVAEVAVALGRARLLEAAAWDIADLEWRAWRRDGEDVATVPLADLDRLADRIVALRAVLNDGRP